MKRLLQSAFVALVAVAPALAGGAPPRFDTWTSFDTRDGLPSNKTMCVLATDGDVWVGTDSGLARYHNDGWTTFTKKEGLAHNAVLALAEDAGSGDIWIATMGGLTRYSAGRWDSFTQLNSGLVNDVVYGVTVHRGDVWAATAAGASRYRIASDEWVIYDETNTPMHEIWCYSVAARDNKVYLAVWGGGLLEYDISRDRWKDYTDPDGEMEIDLFRNDGLVHDVVAGVTVDNVGRVWIGTYFGLSSYDGRHWRNFMEHDSPLASNFINFVQARGDYAWIGTDYGLNATDRESFWTYRRDSDSGKGLIIFNPVDGPAEKTVIPTIFPHNYILGISFRDEEIWVATENGVARGTQSSTAGASESALGAHAQVFDSTRLASGEQRQSDDSPVNHTGSSKDGRSRKDADSKNAD